jgi:hypothetical protein
MQTRRSSRAYNVAWQGREQRRFWLWRRVRVMCDEVSNTLKSKAFCDSLGPVKQVKRIVQLAATTELLCHLRKFHQIKFQ